MIEFFRRLKINHAFEKNKRKHAFHSLSTMKSVLILFHLKDWMKIQLIAKDLERQGKIVHLWTVESSEENINGITIPLKMRILLKKELSGIAFLKSKVEKEFRDLKYDTLFDFCHKDGEGFEYLSYLLAINSAEFCIGNREHRKGVYDLVVKQEPGVGALETYGHMKSFLQNIKP